MKSIIKNKVLTYASPDDVVIENGQRVYYIPSNAKKIENNAFIAFTKTSSDSTYLSDFNKANKVNKIVFNNIITEVPSIIFQNVNTKEVVLTEKISKIGFKAFLNSEITKINIPKSVKKIEPYAFMSCNNLNEVVLPNSVKILQYGTFKCCKNLKKITLPQNLTKLEESCFENCKSLESIIIPNNVTEIGAEAFKNCVNLKEIHLSKNISKYNFRCFDGCKNLTELVLQNSSNTPSLLDRSIFNGCENLETLIFNGKFNFRDKLTLCHCNKIKNLTFNKQSYDFSAFLNTRIFLDEVNNLEKLSKISKSIKSYVKVQYEFAKQLCHFMQEEEFTNSYFKFYNRLNEKYYTFDILSQDKFGFEKFCYNLGLFNKNKDISNKAYNFLEEMLSKNILEINKCYSYFKHLNPNGYKKEYVDFITKKENFLELIKLEETEHRMLTPIYNSFELLQKDNLSRNNHHRQLAPSVKRFKEMLTIEKFENVNKENLQIANEIGKFTNNQHYFDIALKLNEECKEMIKKTGYKDKNIQEDPFESIEKLEKEILKSNYSSLHTLGSFIDNSYTFEWLSKNDPRNFMLGYYCSCCCHLGGAGDGIVRASITLPNVHNLVVKDSKNRIIAKATRYVNKKQQYALFNTFQVSESISTLIDQEKIFEKLIKGTLAYVKEYNKTHKKLPIKKVNVGSGLNDLEFLLSKYYKKSNMLEGINFVNYKLEHEYEGDWYNKQYCIFDINNTNKINNNQNLEQ